MSQWFAQYAHAQENKTNQGWSQFLDQLDATFGQDAINGLDHLLSEGRQADLAPTLELESL